MLRKRICLNFLRLSNNRFKSRMQRIMHFKVISDWILIKGSHHNFVLLCTWEGQVTQPLHFFRNEISLKTLIRTRQMVTHHLLIMKMMMIISMVKKTKINIITFTKHAHSIMSLPLSNKSIRLHSMYKIIIIPHF